MTLTVLLDTNVMMVALSPRSNLHILWQKLVNCEFNVVVNTEILLEYEEQIRKRYAADVIAEFMMIINEAPNVISHEPFFKWNLILEDVDDNKFVDTAFSSSADYIVTHDKHFNFLKQVSFPVINFINAFQFLDLLIEQK